MQKKLIALAVAGMIAAPVAMAQSNVTVYGIADMGVGSQKANGGKSVTKVDDNLWSSSRLGFRGTEDLGNGLKAIFQFEMGTLDLDTGGGVSMGRDTFVGLTGDFGTVRLGRYLTPIGAWGGNFEATGGANAFRVDQIIGGTQSLRWAFDGVRVSNAASYISPNFNGLTFAALYAPDEVVERDVVVTAGSLVPGAVAIGETATGEPIYAVGTFTPAVMGTEKVKEDIWGIGLRYDNGPLSAMYAYHEQDNVADIHMVGASYDFGMAALKAQYSQGKADGASDKEKAWNIGVAVPVSEAGKFTLAYGKMDNIGSVKNSDADQWALTYNHSLSVRTSVWAGYSDIDRDKTDTGDVRTIAVGVTHKF